MVTMMMTSCGERNKKKQIVLLSFFLSFYGVARGAKRPQTNARAPSVEIILANTLGNHF